MDPSAPINRARFETITPGVGLAQDRPLSRQAIQDSVDVAVDSVADLTTLVDDARVSDGFPVWCRAAGSTHGLWRLDQTSTIAVDGSSVVATSSGVGRWIYFGSASAQVVSSGSYSSGSYYVDPVAGDDAGTGRIDHPWKTWSGVRRNLNEIYAQRVDVYLLGDMPASDPFLVEAMITSTGGLFVHGVRRPVAGGTGTFTNVTPRDPAANQKLTLTDAARPSWASVLEKLIVITASAIPAHVGAASFVHTNVGGGVCQTGSFVKADSVSSFFGISEIVPSIGDSYEIFDLVKVDGDVYVSGRGAKRFAAGTSALLLDSLYLTGANGSTIISENHGVVQVFEHCRFGDRVGLRAPEFSGTGQTIVANCMNDYGFKTRTADADVSVYGGVNGSSVNGGAGEVYQGGNVYLAMGHLLVQSHAILVQGPCQFVVGDVGVFDKGAPAINVNGNGYLVFRSAIGSKLWGASSVAGFYALNVDPGTVAYQGDPAAVVTLARNGVPQDFTLGGRASGPAMNPDGTSTADVRDYTIANLKAAIAAGGFGGSCIDPVTGNRIIVTPTS